MNVSTDLTKLGLNDDQVLVNREKYGSNILTPPQRDSIWKLYFEKFKDPIIRILIFAAILSIILGFFNGEFIEAIGIVVTIFLATGIGFYFEYSAARRFEALNAMGHDNEMMVMRNGVVTQVRRSEIVVGDIVLLEQGVEIPADGILLEAVSLQVNESSLTGELMVNKTTDETHFDSNATYASNKVMRSTFVTEGHGAMKVEAVGDATEIGAVAEQATIESDEQTPLTKQLERLAGVINKIAFGVSIVAFVLLSSKATYEFYVISGSFAAFDWLAYIELILKYFMMAVTLIVMAVPEGLPMAVTLSLALNMRRMLKTNNLVRKMHACETMGAITVICTDKTGTLTQNRMKVGEMHIESLTNESVFLEGLSVNTTAHLQGENMEEGVGNPTECALLLWMHDQKKDYKIMREQAPIVNQLTFSTENKYMATIVTSSVNGKRMLYVKGAPEIVSTFCDLSADASQKLLVQLKDFQNKAMRTLAFAYREIDENEEIIDCKTLVEQKHLVYMGVAAISDPVREEVPAAVNQCLDAGINVKIVTGDTAGTAIEIARRIGLWKEGDTPDMAITGPEFAELSDEEALERIKKLKVMSRARPLNKQRLVKLLQQQGEVVAVTGDGTNDAPALNHAQVGLSMGSGTSVAKDASDITLLDDSFNSIATAVMWGRSLYRNIQRFVVFQLTINLAALLIVLVGAFVGTELPLTVTQILWINIIMDTFAALALSSLPPTRRVMSEKPRKADAFIITKAMKYNIIGTGCIFFLVLLMFLLSFGATPTKLQLTEFFSFFVILQFWNLFNAKAFGTSLSAFHNLKESKVFIGILFVILIGQWLIVTLGGAMFRTVPMSLNTWGLILVVTSITLWLGEIIRFFKRKRK